MFRKKNDLQGSREAKVDFHHGRFTLREAGDYVRCAVTGEEISLEDLQYWNVDLQEAYASVEVVAQAVARNSDR